MIRFRYNDIEFAVEPGQSGWDIIRIQPDGAAATVGANLFAGAAAAEVETRARALIAAIHPVGVKLVGPDVGHPLLIGDLKIVGPDITHPVFVHWDKDSASFPDTL